MTREEAIKMLTAKVECMKREISGSDEECNSHNCGECNLCYEQGNMGEQVECLQMAIKALEQSERKPGKWIRKTFEDWWCNQCGNEICTETPENYYYCPNCGADMRGEVDEG